ncbi:metabolite-proton symporter [Pseudonocardia sediminis]|uniref:Putative proline/betaine transporter n=1 Tax=Pseudonocardia sediminis TaxID=1397368 RepID=A0A4V2FRG3_PSEST|nr:MFS transporter [Pseudonocardia sediminis]RZT88510.1 metabolite-proton symporter [Pseudonocardia sediminis]
MSEVRGATSPSGAPPERSSIVKIVSASMLGTTVEWYDFFLYGVAAAIVFPAVFFPDADPTAGTLLSLGTFAIGFVARPLGGLVFGHYGDKIGRKKLLVLSLLMMGVSTFLIGLLPGYATIGIAAPLLLVLLRLVQGFALGGEWGGAVLIVSEHGDPARRGFWASWPQAGAPAGQLLANGLLAVMAVVQSEAAFESWGWRIPFLLSAVLVLIGLYVRLSVEESPVFRDAQARAAERAAAGTRDVMPILDVLRLYPREVLTAMGARFAENVAYYIFTIVVSTYMQVRFGLPTSFVLGAVLIGAAVHIVTIPIWGAVSDRVGRRPVYLFGAVGIGAWAFAFFALLDTQNFALVATAVVVGLLFHGAMYGPQAAFLSELFGTKVRYSGVSIGYQLASVLAGGLAPLIAASLLAVYGNGYAIAIYVAACSVVTIVAVATYSETRTRRLDADDALPPAR